MTKSLIRSMNRRGSQSDKSPAVARKLTFSDPSICQRCGAVYTDRTWRRGRRLTGEAAAKAKWTTCPGCMQVASGEYYGQVLIDVGDADRDAVLARIRNVERRAMVTQPERRIVNTDWSGQTLDVMTTSQKLAHRIACEIEKAFGGVTHLSWSDNEGSLRATVKIAPHATKLKSRTRPRQQKRAKLS